MGNHSGKSSNHSTSLTKIKTELSKIMRSPIKLRRYMWKENNITNKTSKYPVLFPINITNDLQCVSQSYDIIRSKLMSFGQLAFLLPWRKHAQIPPLMAPA